MKFQECPLKPEILQALEHMGFTELTPIQEQTFSPILAGRDILALAETGSGKTSACGIPLAQKIDPSKRAVQALVLVPTRELALQYVDELDLIGRYLHISPFAIYGGFPMDIQRAKLADGVHILVATPGRLIDHLYNSDLSLSEVKTLVLDEADEMLALGFIDDVRFIMSCIVGRHQTLLFSATMPEDIKELAASCLHDPVTVELNLEIVAPPNISHHFLMTAPHEKLTALKNYCDREKFRQMIIFCNSRKSGEELFRKLKSKHASLEYIHGGLDQARRTAIFDKFKMLKIKMLIATDVAGRGLDFTHVSHILNYDFPQNAEIYTHRTGRTGRMGRAGTALTFVALRNIEALKRLLKQNRIDPIWVGPPPDMHRRSKTSGRKRGRPGRRGKGNVGRPRLSGRKQTRKPGR
jgi:ATP-dependent RNA helicase DeaD